MKKILNGIKFNIKISKDQIEKLRKMATYEISVSEHIRRAIDDYLKDKELG